MINTSMFRNVALIAFCLLAAYCNPLKSEIRSNAEEEQVVKSKPNIVIIVSDDQGYGDSSFQDEHPAEISTPAIDQLAASGMVFTNGYASGYVCAPTRAGLLTGRYQQRFGFYRASDSRQGMPLSEKTIADYLKEEGYTSGIFGKWHLGLEYDYRPLQRGFDEFYGFLGHGAHSYFDLKCSAGDEHNCIYRNNKIIEDEGYLTDILAEESVNFIDKQSKSADPFFLYLPFNAVHAPLHALEADIARFNTGDKDRDIMLGMLYRMDIAIARVVDKLKETGQYENTIIFYFSDNGGAAKIHANNAPLRDFKQSTYEGGVRVPFIISWPKNISSGKSDEPVISLDILPTILEVIGKDLPKDRVFDGKSILPVIEGTIDGSLHDQLVWDGDEDKWAIRQGDFKLVKNKKGDIELYNLKNDIGESNNIISSNATIAKKLQADYDKWRSEMGTPMGKKRKK
ncbi:MAG: sulfatase-like hydrolase/transferase [Cyclobacteriaceae bacterium]